MGVTDPSGLRSRVCGVDVCLPGAGGGHRGARCCCASGMRHVGETLQCGRSRCEAAVDQGVKTRTSKVCRRGCTRENMATPWLTDAGAGKRLRWSLDIVERCSDQWAEADMVGCKKSVLQS